MNKNTCNMHEEISKHYLSANTFYSTFPHLLYVKYHRTKWLNYLHIIYQVNTSCKACVNVVEAHYWCNTTFTLRVLLEAQTLPQPLCQSRSDVTFLEQVFQFAAARGQSIAKDSLTCQHICLSLGSIHMHYFMHL